MSEYRLDYNIGDTVKFKSMFVEWGVDVIYVGIIKECSIYMNPINSVEVQHHVLTVDNETYARRECIGIGKIVEIIKPITYLDELVDI